MAPMLEAAESERPAQPQYEKEIPNDVDVCERKP